MKEIQIRNSTEDFLVFSLQAGESGISVRVHNEDVWLTQKAMGELFGCWILEEEQQGKARADYGTYLIRNLAKAIEPEYGSGFGVRQLERARLFYRTYPIASTLRSQLNWSQYKMLISIADPDKREYYELESVNNAWTARETERQIDSMLYERLLASNDKEAVFDRSTHTSPSEYLLGCTQETPERGRCR